MRFEYGIIIVMGVLTAAILASIVSEPHKIPYWESFRHFEITKMAYTDDPDMFEKTKNKQDSTCYASNNGNSFCYEPPRIDDKGFGISYLTGENGVDGEMHFDSIQKGVSYFTMTNMTLNNNTAIVTLADKNYSRGGQGIVKYSIDEKFEHYMEIEKFDTFVTHCHNYDGTVINIVQYLGVIQINGTDYFVTWHTIAESSQGIACDYPEIIQNSLEFNFEEM